VTTFNDLEYLRSSLIHAEEQLSMADDLYSKNAWGQRCDALESAILDILDGDDR
jgi:hypothetical protein